MENEWKKIANKHGFKLKNWEQRESRYDFELNRDGMELYSTIRIFDEVDGYPKMIEFSINAYSENVAGIYFEFASEVLHDIYLNLKEKGRINEHEIVPCGGFIIELDEYRIIKEDDEYTTIEKKFGHLIENIRNNQTDEGVEEGAFGGEVGKRIAEYLEKKGLGKKKKFYNSWLFLFDPYCPHEIYDKVEEIKVKWGA